MTHDDVMYIFGGYTNDGLITNDVYTLFFDGCVWERLSLSPAPPLSPSGGGGTGGERKGRVESKRRLMSGGEERERKVVSPESDLKRERREREREGKREGERDGRRSGAVKEEREEEE